MRYLNEKDLLAVGLNWNETIDAIEDAVVCLEKKDFAQPVKPYLRYRDPVNRIIKFFRVGRFQQTGDRECPWSLTTRNVDGRGPPLRIFRNIQSYFALTKSFVLT